ncbi:hypothetical protein [Methylobacterium planeticum]|uniref:Uncharacterized protein n=1 Tax=Methylobacterium planeticum TaxID=2615211 RepID=A0A6N6MFB3_9HYPH|nr:hypothetical protein [Methylobacterium planeticum]KAB1069478.1 hypothetical protein F6X51_25295 [Methylobacterium planeticum]
MLLTPTAIDVQPGTFLGSVSGELDPRLYLEGLGHELVATSSKDGAGSERVITHALARVGFR